MDYITKEVEALQIKYEVEDAAHTFMVSEGKWSTCEMSSQDINIPTHQIDTSEPERNLWEYMSRKCCDYIDAVLASQAILKPSKASGLVQICPHHYQEYCHFPTTMSEEKLHTIWSKDDKQVQSLINKDPVRKASIAALIAQMRLMEDTLKNGTAVEMVTEIINDMSIAAKDYISCCIDHVSGEGAMDTDFFLNTLQKMHYMSSLRQWLML